MYLLEISGFTKLHARDGGVDIATKTDEDLPGAYWLLLGPDVEHRRSSFEARESSYPDEWPSASRDEAVSYFETRSV